MTMHIARPIIVAPIQLMAVGVGGLVGAGARVLAVPALGRKREQELAQIRLHPAVVLIALAQVVNLDHVPGQAG